MNCATCAQKQEAFEKALERIDVLKAACKRLGLQTKLFEERLKAYTDERLDDVNASITLEFSDLDIAAILAANARLQGSGFYWHIFFYTTCPEATPMHCEI